MGEAVATAPAAGFSPPVDPQAPVPQPAAAIPPAAAQPGVPGQPLAPPATDPSGAPAPPGGQQAAGGTLHIAVHDWSPDQQGQLRVQRGQLIFISYEAAHGWVYGTVRANIADPASQTAEGWVPKAVAKRVSLCQAVGDWQAEGSGTLGVKKGEWIAVSREADRGWVYGERVGPRTGDPLQPMDGWLPKKVLEYTQI